MYYTDFGLITPQVETRIPYSSFKAELTMKRGSLVYLFKSLPPIGTYFQFDELILTVITVLVCGLVMLLDVDLIDVQIGSALGGILALIFLQLAFSTDHLPSNLNYLTLVGSKVSFSF